MELNEAFDEFQMTVDADPAQVRLARDRRDLFKEALGAEDDVQEVFGSGSLRRSTQLKPVHDVDLVAVYDGGKRPEWGSPGSSAEVALRHVGERVNHLLGATNGVVETAVRLAKPRNHAVKCFLDDPDDPEAFTVDVMPALRQPDGTLLIPEMLSEQWVPADPEDLIRRVRKHQAAWPYFRPMVRALKLWRLDVAVDGRIKSLVMEILALKCMPRGGSRPEALRAFFTAAAVRVNEPIEDPAGLCGPIQPDLDVAGLRDGLAAAADAATAACAAAANGDTDDALRAWQGIFGSAFPAPPAPKKINPGAVGPAFIPSRPVKDAPQG